MDDLWTWGSTAKKRKKQKRHRSPTELQRTDGPKLLKYAALGKTRKVRVSLALDAALLNYADPNSGITALHQACRHGHADLVGLLLRRHANPNATDSNGNTPGHLAAMHGHWLVLSELIKQSEQPIDLAASNHAGLTIRQVMQRHNEGAAAATAAAEADERSDHGHNSDSSGAGKQGPGGTARGDGGGDTAAAAAAAGDDDASWHARLAEEMSDDEFGWGGLAGSAWGQPATELGKPIETTEVAAAAAASDDDDLWADRLWRDMQEHRRQTAAAKSSRTGFTGFSRSQADRRAAAEERQRKAEAAAAESARILREEQAKDSDWRAAMMRQVEQAALPSKRESYESKWASLLSWPASKPITYRDVPWPPCHKPGGSSRTDLLGKAPAALDRQLDLDAGQLRALVFAGATGPESVKLALRKELMRWHPDKFGAKFGGRLAAADKDSILAGVHAVAQQLTALKQS